MTGGGDVQRGMPQASAWRLRVLAALAGFPDGVSIARLTRLLADGTRPYDAVYDSIYNALRSCQRCGYVRRVGPARARARVQFTWNNDPNSHTCYGDQAVYWQLTPAGTAYLTSHGQEGHPGGEPRRAPQAAWPAPAAGVAR
jgi:hypothetical protein